MSELCFEELFKHQKKMNQSVCVPPQQLYVSVCTADLSPEPFATRSISL